jgi:hypothetical protein
MKDNLMMANRLVATGLVSWICLTGASCTTVTTRKADLDQPPSGVRIYAPRVYFAVDTTKQETTVLVLPDFQRVYDLKPVTVFAKQDFKVELDEGILKTLTANQDTTGILSLFKEGATLGAKAAGVSVSAQTIRGTLGLPTGLYVLTDNGKLAPVPRYSAGGGQEGRAYPRPTTPGLRASLKIPACARHGFCLFSPPLWT